MTDTAASLDLADAAFGAGLLPPRSIRHAEARELVERDDALANLPRALREVLETVPATAKGIRADRRLSAQGQAEALEQAGGDAGRGIAAIVKPVATKVAGQIDRSLARTPGATEPITRRELGEAVPATRGGSAAFAASDELALVERIRTLALESDAAVLTGVFHDAATSGDVRTFFAIDSLPPALHRRALANAMVADDAWRRLRGVLRAARDPQAAAEAATLGAVGSWIHANATNARAAIERSALTLAPAASQAIDASIEDLVEQLRRIGA